MLRVLILFVLSFSTVPTGSSTPPAAGTSTADDDVPVFEVGDRKVRGKSLRPFDATWKSAGGMIKEVATIERRDKRKCLVRIQIWPMGGGVSMRSELVLDHETLKTISFEQKVVGLTAGMSLGGQASYMRWDYDGPSYVCTVRREGAEDVSEGTLPTGMFDGSGLGLVIAALPLEEGFDARLPVAMNLGGTGDLTLYSVRLRVSGKETFDFQGRSVEAWVVDSEWADYETGVVSSPGGADQSGGAYFVVPDPPKGFPHVPAYRNDSMSLDVTFSDEAE